MLPARLFGCFTSTAGGTRDGARLDANLPSIEIQRVNNSKSFESVLQRASTKKRLVVVEWAANWCSLCLEADLEFTHLAATLAVEQPGQFKLVRVNLDKAEDLALKYKVITLPSFSIFQDDQLMEHYTGLESCSLMHQRLQMEAPSQACHRSSDLSRGLPEMVVATSRDSGDWDACASSASSDCSTYTADISPSQRTTSLEWNAFAPSQYLPRYKQQHRASVDSIQEQKGLKLGRHQRRHSAS